MIEREKDKETWHIVTFKLLYLLIHNNTRKVVLEKTYPFGIVKLLFVVIEDLRRVTGQLPILSCSYSRMRKSQTAHNAV